jgi:Lon protease-like protein
VSRRIPLFPLPEVVLLPETLLPLHIFEPRYRAMIADALAGDRVIGMAMMKPGWAAQPERPPIYPVGGAGEIVESEELPDGRYNIVLQGRFRYRVLREASADPYRTAQIEEVASIPFAGPDEASRVIRMAQRLFEAVRPEMDLPPLPEEEASPERMASEIALRLRYSPADLQTILETDSIPNRFGSLIGRMLEWQRRMRFLAPFRPRELDVTKN